MLRKIVIVVICVIVAYLIFLTGSFVGSIDKASTDSPTYSLDSVISASRSPNWKYGLGFYAAVVTAEKSDDGKYRSTCKVHIANANYFENVDLGKTNTFEDAVLKWSKLMWTDDELIIGSDENAVHVKRKKIETHR